jgi:hypothetical protein
MGSSVTTPHDVFIVYSKGDPFESNLVESIKERLYDWGLTAWVYEDWEWEKESIDGPRWRSYGTTDQLDLVRYAVHDPEPFEHRPSGPKTDHETLAWMFEHCGAIIVIAPRRRGLSPGARVEVDTLRRNPHAAITSVSWDEANEHLVKQIGVFFDYRTPSFFQRDFDVPAESVVRAAWLACMMSRLIEFDAMGRDVFRQLAQND